MQEKLIIQLTLMILLEVCLMFLGKFKNLRSIRAIKSKKKLKKFRKSRQKMKQEFLKTLKLLQMSSKSQLKKQVKLARETGGKFLSSKAMFLKNLSRSKRIFRKQEHTTKDISKPKPISVMLWETSNFACLKLQITSSVKTVTKIKK